MFEREKEILKKICESLKLKDDEFSDIDIDEEVDRKLREEVRIINARCESYLPSD